jgi:hypothetical protein
MAHFSAVTLDTLSLSGVVAGRTPHLNLEVDGAAVRATLATQAEPLLCPWHPQGFEDQTNRPRKTVSFVVSDAAREWVQQVEAAVLERLQADPEKYLPGATADSLKVLFRSGLKEGPSGWLLRCKISVSGAGAARCWGPGRKQMPMPDLGGSKVVPFVCAKHVWLSPTTVGVLWDVTDLFIVTVRPPAECPWDF